MTRDELVCSCGNNTFFFERDDKTNEIYYAICTACKIQKEITYWMTEDGEVFLVVMEMKK